MTISSAKIDQYGAFGDPSLPGTNGRIETDSHADTCCAGSNCVVVEFTNHVINVYPYHKDLGKMKSVPIASVATLAMDLNGQE